MVFDSTIIFRHVTESTEFPKSEYYSETHSQHTKLDIWQLYQMASENDGMNHTV